VPPRPPLNDNDVDPLRPLPSRANHHTASIANDGSGKLACPVLFTQLTNTQGRHRARHLHHRLSYHDDDDPTTPTPPATTMAGGQTRPWRDGRHHHLPRFRLVQPQTMAHIHLAVSTRVSKERMRERRGGRCTTFGKYLTQCPRSPLPHLLISLTHAHKTSWFCSIYSFITIAVAHLVSKPNAPNVTIASPLPPARSPTTALAVVSRYPREWEGEMRNETA
jgi:hypothetical protein